MLSSDQPPSFLSPQGGGSGEEQLCADFPELDLSQLDASDFDSATCFGELQWCPESSDTEPSQYSPDDSELFQVCPLELRHLLSSRPLLCPLKARLCPASSQVALLKVVSFLLDIVMVLPLCVRRCVHQRTGQSRGEIEPRSANINKQWL